MSPASRNDGRAFAQLRAVEIVPHFVRAASGSALMSAGGTRVICTASAEESVPRWMAGRGSGWLTAEYSMMPASTGRRRQRDVSRGRPDGRTVEIQRLIGRSLRGAVDFDALGERTIYIDCDVLEADGGTRCASITGAYVALALACLRLREEGRLERSPLNGSVAAVSCGIVDGEALLDLDYSEDSRAEVDANVVMMGDGGLVEVQATAERTPLSRAHLDVLLALAGEGIGRLRQAQEDAIAAGAPGVQENAAAAAPAHDAAAAAPAHDAAAAGPAHDAAAAAPAHDAAAAAPAHDAAAAGPPEDAAEQRAPEAR